MLANESCLLNNSWRLWDQPIIHRKLIFAERWATEKRQTGWGYLSQKKISIVRAVPLPTWGSLSIWEQARQSWSILEVSTPQTNRTHERSRNFSVVLGNWMEPWMFVFCSSRIRIHTPWVLRWLYFLRVRTNDDLEPPIKVLMWDFLSNSQILLHFNS